ncbi:MAG: hypothetical protein F4Y63_06855 [Chloroflexi bacterium]|nr:hypothetical protein [Chloroflexota bacterium]
MSTWSFAAVGHRAKPVQVLVTVVFVVEKYGAETEVVGGKPCRHLPLLVDLGWIEGHWRHHFVRCNVGRTGDVVEDADGSDSFDIANAVVA